MSQENLRTVWALLHFDTFDTHPLLSKSMKANSLMQGQSNDCSSATEVL